MDTSTFWVARAAPKAIGSPKIRLRTDPVTVNPFLKVDSIYENTTLSGPKKEGA